MNLGAGLSRLSLSLADRKILIQRVYRRACAGHIEAPADHGLATQASATADGVRVRVAGAGTRRQYTLWITKSWPRKPLFSLFSLSLSLPNWSNHPFKF